MKLFRRIVLRPLLGDPTRTLLSILSVALGVAVVIAVELAGEAAVGSFRSSLETLSGRVDLEITGNGGVAESTLGELAGLPVGAHYSPILDRTVQVERARPASIQALGIDMIGTSSELEGKQAGEFSAAALETLAIVSSDAARRFGWKAGDKVRLRGADRAAGFTIQAIAPVGTSGWIAFDLAGAARLFDTRGKLDRIEVRLDPGENAELARREIESVVPKGYLVRTPGEQRDEKLKMLDAFRWNLRILSYISLLVGAFFIYNTVAVGVVRRRGEIGVLRALGAGARRIEGIFLAEAAALGIIGSLLGIAAGRAMAGAIEGMLSDTVNALFVTSAPAPVALSVWASGSALLAGTVVALLSAWIPAREAARVAPAEAMRQARVEHAVRVTMRARLAWAAGFAALSAILCIPGPVNGRPVFGYVAALAAVTGMALACPALVAGLLRALRPVARRVAGAAGLVAERSLATALSRTSVVVAALATAIAMMVSVATMVGSFRETVQVWLGSQLSADIYLRGAGPLTAGMFPALDQRVPGAVAGVAGVAEVAVLRLLPIRYRGTQATLGAEDLELVRRRGILRFLEGDFPQGSDKAIISEPFANKHGLRTGQVVRVAIGEHEVALTVTGVFFDYSNDRGLIFVDRSTLLRYLPGQPVSSLAIYVKPGADATEVRHEIEGATGEFPVLIAANRDLREGAVRVFDRTFAVTWALEGIAIVVAMLGAANALLALVLDRRREIGLIRYLGADGGQVRAMILTEAGLLGVLAIIPGLLLGLALSLVLIFVINKQSFGWTIQFHPPILLLAGALSLVWTMTVLSGFWPARYAARMETTDALRSE